MQYSVKYFLPHIVFFSVFLAVVIPFLYYYRRRNPNPRFRPSAGEVTLVAVILLMLGGTACWFLGNYFRGEQRLDNTVPDAGAGWSGGTSGPQDTGGFRKD